MYCIIPSMHYLLVLSHRLRRIKALVLAIASGAPEEALAGLGPLGEGEEHVPPHLEIAYLPYEQGGPYPGLFFFTQAARMARPVLQVCYVLWSYELSEALTLWISGWIIKGFKITIYNLSHHHVQRLDQSRAFKR